MHAGYQNAGLARSLQTAMNDVRLCAPVYFKLILGFRKKNAGSWTWCPRGAAILHADVDLHKRTLTVRKRRRGCREYGYDRAALMWLPFQKALGSRRRDRHKTSPTGVDPASLEDRPVHADLIDYQAPATTPVPAGTDAGRGASPIDHRRTRAEQFTFIAKQIEIRNSARIRNGAAAGRFTLRWGADPPSERRVENEHAEPAARQEPQQATRGLYSTRWH
jgi:hypothetical protein